MMRCVFPILALMLITLSEQHVRAAGDQDLHFDLSKALFEQIEATHIECPADLKLHGDPRFAVCTSTQLNSKQLRRAVKDVLNRRDDVVALPGPKWVRRNEYQARRIFIEQQLWVLLIRDEVLVWMPDQSCFDADILSDPKLRTPRSPGVAIPDLEQRAVADYPKAARGEQLSGFAMVQAVVTAQGAVGRTCLLFVAPEDVGFGPAALNAVKRFRYQAAMLDGAPVDFLVNVSVTWEMR
jgi:TonB family protein